MTMIAIKAPTGVPAPAGACADLIGQTDMDEYTTVAANGRWQRMTAEQRARQMAGLVKRNRENSPRRKYTFDQRYFKEIDTPEKAYWLGFIAGDGTVAQGGVTIALKASDANHLRLLAQALQSDAPVRYYVAKVAGKEYPTAKFSATSWRMVDDLAGHGIHPRKSHTLEPWRGPADLMPHYWRGLVDADGYIGKEPDWGMGLVGTLAVVTAFGKWVVEVEPSVTAQPRPNKSIWRFTVGGRVNTQPVVRALYLPGDVALPRKAERAAALIASGPTLRGTDEWKANLSAKLKGRAPSQANRDAHGTPEARERARQRGLGRVHSEETRRKMSESHQRRIAAERLAAGMPALPFPEQAPGGK